MKDEQRQAPLPSLADIYEEQARRVREFEAKSKQAQAEIEQKWRKEWSQDAAKLTLESIQSLQAQINELARAFMESNPTLSLHARLAALEQLVAEKR
jgi:vacuolar-type H+-ATPase subunit I/STV1